MEWAAGELEWRSGLLTRLPGGAHERENGKDRTEVHSGARGGFSPPLEFNTTVCHISGMHLIAAECNANFSGAELCATRKGMACMVLCMACKLLINALRKVKSHECFKVKQSMVIRGAGIILTHSWDQRNSGETVEVFPP